MHRANRPEPPAPDEPPAFRQGSIKFVMQRASCMVRSQPRIAAGPTAEETVQPYDPPSSCRSSAPGELTRMAISARTRAEHARERERVAHAESKEQRIINQLRAAKAGHEKVVSSLTAVASRQRTAAAELEAYRLEAHSKRVGAVAELKASTAAAAERAAQQSLSRASRRAAAERRRDAEIKELKASGCDNPYLVLRLREEEARVAREQRRTEEEVQARLVVQKSETAAKLRRERDLREQREREETAGRTRRMHVNPPFVGGPRTQTFGSCVELG
jgi:hypothetical protein